MTTFFLKKIKSEKVIMEGKVASNKIYCWSIACLNSEKKFYINTKDDTIPVGFRNILLNYTLPTQVTPLNKSKFFKNVDLTNYYETWINMINTKN